MRIRQIVEICRTNILLLDYEGNPESNTISSFESTVSAVESFRKYQLFETQTADIVSVGAVYKSRLEEIRVDSSTFNKWRNSVFALKLVCSSFIETVQSRFQKSDDLSVSVKLPTMNNLSDLESFLHEFNTIFNQTLLEDPINSDSKIVSFENGSLWFEIFLGTQLAFSLLAGMAWSAAVVRKKIIEGKIFVETGITMKLKNESINDMKEAQKLLLDQLVEAETNALLTHNSLVDATPDFTNRLRHSIRMLADLIDRGTEIHPSLTAPEEVKNLLPKYDQLDKIISRIEMLGPGDAEA